MNGRHGRSASTILAAAAATAFTLTGLMAPASAAQAAGSASRLTVSSALQRRLLGLYASYRHVPIPDVARAAARSVQGARTASGTDWALMTLVPAQTASLAIRIGFQDGAGVAVFTRSPGKNWKVAGLGGQPLGCDSAIPAPVRRLWRFGRCPAVSAGNVAPRAAGTQHSAGTPRAAVTPQAAGSAASGTTADIASIAEDEVGVADTPPDNSFSDEDADCDPFTTLENPSAPDAGCGTDPQFDIQDHAEYWCSDFAKWVWSQGGVTSDLGTLTPLSSSFYTWGLQHGESMPVDGTDPQVGDAIVLYPSGTEGTAALEADGNHVGIVTAVNPDGTIDVVNGDFQASNGFIQVVYDQDVTPAAFASGSEGSGEEWLYVSPQLPAGSELASSPVATYGQQLQVWGRAADGSVSSDVYTPGKTWSGWTSIGGDLGDDPTAVEYDTSNYGAQLEVFGENAGTVYSDVYTSGWSGWMSLGGDVAGDPVAIQYGTQMQVWGREADGSVWSDVYTPGKTWSGWTSIRGDLSGDPSPVEYDTSNYGEQLEVFGQDAGVTSGDVWTAGSGWSGWTSLGGNLADNPVAVQYGTQMQVWGRAASGQTYSDVYTPGKTWSGWISIEGDLLP
jgi:hypothetical protein